MARTKRELEKKRKEEKCELVGAAETGRELAEWRRLGRKNLNKLSRPAEKRATSASLSEQLARTPEPPSSKGKGAEPSVEIAR